MGSARVRRDRDASADGRAVHAARAALTLAVALAAALPVRAQGTAGERVDTLLTEIEDGAERAPRRAELERLHGELAAAFDAAGRLEWRDTQALAWAAFELANPEPADAAVGVDALAILERARLATRKYGPSELRADAEHYLAYERRKRGLVALAREELERAVEELASTRRFLPFLYLELGECARLTGDWNAAQAAIDEAERLHAATRDARPDFENAAIEATIPLLRTLYHIDLGVPDHAFHELVRARAVVAESGDRAMVRALALVEIAFAESTDDYAGALARIQAEAARSSAASPAERAQLERSGAYALAGLSRREPARAAEAIAAYERALAAPALYEFLRPVAEIRLAELEIRRERFARAAELLASARARLADAERRAAGGRGRHDAALLAAIAARLALDSHASADEVAQALAELESAFGRFLDDWASVPARRDGVGFLRYDERCAIVVELVRVTLAVDPARGAERALEHMLRAQALGNLSSALGGERPALAEVRAALCGPRRGALVYVPGPERSYAFALDSASITAFELAARDAWSDLREEWAAQVSLSPALGGDPDARRAEIARLGSELAVAFLPPELRVWLAGLDEVSIGGLDLTGYLPFEALPWRDGESLGDRLAIAYVPSLVAAAKIARRGPFAALERPRLCVVAAPHTGPASDAPGDASPPALRGGSEPLEWHARREDALARAYGVGGFELALGERATLAALGSSSASGCAVVEVTAHGFYDAASWPPVGFLLAAADGHDGWVRCSDVEIRSAPPLVMLAVCGAARGPQREGDDGVGDFSGAFFKAGAQCVVLSPVDLEQHATEALFDEFHRALAVEGASPAAAMLAARRALADTDHADPYYRSLVHVVGLGHRSLCAVRPRPAGRPPAWWYLAVLGVAAALAAGGVAVVSRRARGAGE